MSKILFSKQNIIDLEKTKNILRVSECSIAYTDEFLLKNICQVNFQGESLLKMYLILK